MVERRAVLIENFNARLLTARSVSLLLQEWCRGPVQARKIGDRNEPPTLDMRERLRAGPDEAVSYRFVHLLHNDIVLSHAEVWYRDDCLTPQMHEALQVSDRPFGLIVSTLGQRRETYEIGYLEAPFMLEHRAVLISGAGIPFGIVRERYMETVLVAGDRA